MLLVLFATLCIGSIDVSCSTINGGNFNLSLVILNSRNPLTATTNSPEKKTPINRCSRDFAKIYVDNVDSALLDVKLEVISPKKINYIRNNASSDYFSETSDNYPEFSKMEIFLKKISQEVFCEDQKTATQPNEIKPERNFIPEEYAHQSRKYSSHGFNSIQASGEKIALIDTSTSANFVPLCTSYIGSIKPRQIRNIKGDYVQVVNYEEYEQTMLVEVCGESLGTSCGSYSKLFPNGLQPVCRQHFIYRKTAIFADSPKDPNKPIEFEYIPIPASCVCDLKDLSLK